MIDKNGLAITLANIAVVCELKADHIEENWQDNSLAKVWRKTGKAIDRVANSDRTFGRKAQR